jgi:hypothetical protein
MLALPDKLYRGVASQSPHHREALNFGTCTPKGRDTGHGIPGRHSGGDTNSAFTSWTTARSVAEGYARSSPQGAGVVLEIEFASKVAPKNTYHYVGERLGEDEYLIEGVISGVRVTPIRTPAP